MSLNPNVILFIREREINPTGSINYGMAILATSVSKKYKVEVIDNSSQYVMYSQNDILKRIEEYRPAVICFSIITLNALRSYRTIAAIKEKYKDIPIVAGGLHVSNVYNEVLEYKVDFAVRGEADLVILPLIDQLVSGGSIDEIKEHLNIQGVSYRRNGKIIDGGICPVPMDLDSYSFADYSLYDLDKYMKTKSSKNSLVFITQRGCPFRCTFCSDEFVRNRVRYRSIENVISNIEYLHNSLNMELFIIGDADFILSEKRVKEFCEAVIEKGLNKKLKFFVQTDSFRLIEKEILELMKKSGFNSISFGIERLDKETQKRIKKPLKKDIILKNISSASELGFVTQVNYLLGFHFDDEQAIERENKNFLELFNHGADVVSVNILNPMPGTKEYESKKDLLDRWYLNPDLLETYRPLYLMTKNLIYDPVLINIYSFDRKVIRKIIHTKAFFRSESIKQKSLLFYFLFRILLIISGLSEMLYRNNKKKIEKILFSNLYTILYQMRTFFYFYYSGFNKDKKSHN